MFWSILLTTLILSSDSSGAFIELPHSAEVVASKGDVAFYVDRALFRLSDSLSYVEVYYLLDLETLGERKEDSIREAEYMFSVELRDINGNKKPVKDSWLKKAIKGAKSQFVIDKFDLIVSPGDYEMKVAIEDKNSDAHGEAVLQFSVGRWPPDLVLSEIELAKSIKDSTSPNNFVKYGLEVIPNPLRTVYLERDTIYYFFEIYNLEPDTGNYIVTAAVYDANGNLIRSTRPKVKKKSRIPFAVETGGITLGDMEDGEYVLKVEVVDLSTAERASGSRSFRFVRERIHRGFPPELKEYAYFIDYIATPEELKKFKSLKDDRAKEEFLNIFWRKRDPIPLTPQNEFFAEFVERVKYADEHFSLGKRKGRYTDRGRIYIKYGPPDQIQKVALVSHARDREEWIYFTKGRPGMKFIFVDIEGTGDYELVYSSIEEEPTRPDWKKYIKEWGLIGGEEEETP